jgi:hypothetical protein
VRSWEVMFGVGKGGVSGGVSGGSDDVVARLLVNYRRNGESFRVFKIMSVWMLSIYFIIHS